ncbi:SPOR domain-containing protein [Halothermothrix orenii]|uniref:Sporulation domain protein n=1 Tax=Halothermothrix orenii (strain H 168 / OCM 544 / DSM 9562) TaxID=373903 RepID=B8CY16_HALOH|nr:SPOR domain-containing protein [Halothermothrix orenii]ACL70185.1 Sporulation domain protein [Halothermothrix orenii H 168]
MSRQNTFSLTIMVIVMALLAIFVGYLLGNWLIQMVTGDPGQNTQQVVEDKIIEEEIVDDQGNTQKTPSPETSGDMTGEENLNGKSVDPDQDVIEYKYIKQQLQGEEVYAVQVGAFNNYNNALRLKQELEEKGLQAVITEGVPYKVQLGATTDRQEAEQTEKVVESLGYDAFITH